MIMGSKMAYKNEEDKRAYHKKYYKKNKHRWKLTSSQKETKRKYMLEYNKTHYKDNRDVRLKKQREYYALHPQTKGQRRASSLKSRYGLSVDDYNRLLESQSGCCLLCGVHQDELSYPMFVDHNHESGVVRGLLCSKCNFKVGWIETNLNDLDKIIKYIGD